MNEETLSNLSNEEDEMNILRPKNVDTKLAKI